MKMSVAEQGPACQYAFYEAMPDGYGEVLSFNLTDNTSRKAGKLTFDIPKECVERGRKFAVISVDKHGDAKVCYDADSNSATCTVDVDFEGYALEVIYTDGQ